eukprot:NODE_2337_length_1445_cov_103.539334_g2220_i0.p1 GENE.NODE_2337_length_1445_cov_103.539334_g2220_i0~~NODE_2337_length_1445_cov_103.539334_g2220_i0.p1  ORF type:complete len:390 (+),score=56.47 NODE_2337_length_1445_cov_103.539334_g2220_i0:56-1225(+)
MDSGISVFTSSYMEARKTFRAVTATAPVRDALILRDPSGTPILGMEGEELAIDLAAYGNVTNPRRLLIHTSGVHGVEGFAGSAIQTTVIRNLKESDLGPSDCILFIHAVNPFGMSWHRRWNEDGVDLNRNCFFLPEEGQLTPYQRRGTSNTYKATASVTNTSSIGRFDCITFYIGAAFMILRHGFARLKQALVEGQDAFPEGLFYGGRSLQPSYVMFKEWMEKFLSKTKTLERIVDIHVHTGLGPYGVDALLCDETSEEVEAAFGKEISYTGGSDAAETSICYYVDGTFDQGLNKWLGSLYPKSMRWGCTQEFGTYMPLMVTRALRWENCEWQNRKRATGSPLPAGSAAKVACLGVFYINEDKWKSMVLRRGEVVFDQARRFTFPPPAK